MSFEGKWHRVTEILVCYLSAIYETKGFSATSMNGLHMLFSRFIGIVPVEAMELLFIGFMDSADKQHCLYERYCKIWKKNTSENKSWEGKT